MQCRVGLCFFAPHSSAVVPVFDVVPLLLCFIMVCTLWSHNQTLSFVTLRTETDTEEEEKNYTALGGHHNHGFYSGGPRTESALLSARVVATMKRQTRAYHTGAGEWVIVMDSER